MHDRGEQDDWLTIRKPFNILIFVLVISFGGVGFMTVLHYMDRLGCYISGKTACYPLCPSDEKQRTFACVMQPSAH